MNDASFIRLAGWAAILTSLTTVGVHYVTFQADTFEQRLLLPHHAGYIAHRWMIILHCLCVIISMLGIALVHFRDNRGLISLGFLFYAVFGVAEITRMFSVLEYLNELKADYTAATDTTVQLMLRQSIDHFSLAANTLFSVFIFAFMIGNFCYGLVLAGSPGITRWLGYGFLFWALVGLTGMGNEYLQWPAIDRGMEINAKVFQPLFRLLIGIWLLRQVRFNPGVVA